MFRRLQALAIATILVVAAFSTGLAVPVLPAVPGDPRRRRLVRARPARPVRPRGRLRGQPAARPRRRPDAGDLHAAQHQPAAQAVAGGPQPDDAARRPARSGHHPRRRTPSGRGSSASRWPGAATSGSSRCTSGPATRSASSRPRRRSGRGSASSSIRGSSRCRCGGCRRPAWRAATPRPERTLQTTPLATTVRPYAPGDSMNRIHWRSTARHGEIQVKEFDLEQTADAWIILDLQRSIQTGRGEESTTEAAIRAAASIADKALTENRAVGMTVNAGRTAYLPADRGGRQHQKIMQLLAAVDADSADAARGDAHRLGRPTAPGHDRGRHHRLDGSVLGPAAGRAARARRGLRRRHPGRQRVRPARAEARGPTRRASRAAIRRRPRPPPSAPAPCATPWPSTSCKAYTIGPGRPLGEVLAG